jgi:hypothetical protein
VDNPVQVKGGGTNAGQPIEGESTTLPTHYTGCHPVIAHVWTISIVVMAQRSSCRMLVGVHWPRLSTAHPPAQVGSMVSPLACLYSSLERLWYHAPVTHTPPGSLPQNVASKCFRSCCTHVRIYA